MRIAILAAALLATAATTQAYAWAPQNARAYPIVSINERFLPCVAHVPYSQRLRPYASFIRQKVWVSNPLVIHGRHIRVMAGCLRVVDKPLEVVQPVFLSETEKTFRSVSEDVWRLALTTP